MDTAHAAFTHALDDQHLTITSTFVPWAASRRAVYRNGTLSQNPQDWSLNWRVTLWKGQEPILTTDWSAGIGHAPSYRNHDIRRDGGLFSVLHAERLEYEVRTGRQYWDQRTPIDPVRDEVWASVCRDADVLDYGRFEDWAEETGYDPDSRSAELTYRACWDIAAPLRRALGPDTMTTLRRLAADL